MVKVMTSVFIITRATKAIVSKESSYYRSLILESKNERHSLHKPEQIIDNTCLLYGSTLEGRRTAAKDILKITSKIPVPVIPDKGVYMLPTSSTKNKERVWLAYHHIDFYEQRNDKTFVAFTDGSGLYVNASETTIDMQYKRASQLIVKLNRSTLFGRRTTPFHPNNPNNQN
ncbi:competence protein ComK [Virgibacillus necropolis]|uniref:Competence protein n=1 Tax=Virgibacillus necropolis TaxID=163877 RepID=A0A221M903_9BACI|nr:competence protein ComK [Virgibacillus necropolis]ASN04100.1 competence protein [Virgibacillus necropolis]